VNQSVLKIVTLSLVVTLSSCMNSIMPIQFSMTKNDRTIDQYIADKQFGRAIKALEKRIRNNPTRQRTKIWLLEVKNKAKKFETGIIVKAIHKTKQGKWQGAFVIVDDALHYYPDSRRLNRYRESLSKRQSKSIKRARVRLVSAKTDYLLRVKPVYAELSKLDPTDSDISWKFKKTELEISETAKSLSISGAQAIKQNDYAIAQLYLELADQLNPTQDNTIALANLAQLRAKMQDRARRIAAKRRARLAKKPLTKSLKVQQKKLKKLADRIRFSLMRGNYDRASKLLAKAHHISPEHPEIAKLRLALDSSVNRKVNQLVHIGNKLYSKGRIEQARRSWKRALKLDPKNSQIKSSVERATRVLSKLREIKNQSIN